MRNQSVPKESNIPSLKHYADPPGVGISTSNILACSFGVAGTLDAVEVGQQALQSPCAQQAVEDFQRTVQLLHKTGHRIVATGWTRTPSAIAGAGSVQFLNSGLAGAAVQM